MEPVYMNMSSYPHQDPMHYRPHCPAGMEPRPPMSYGCWPWAGHYGYAAPAACHGCSNHAYTPLPPYAWGSPYSHVPSYHCPGTYPCFPAQYMPPPPYNVMEHQRYEYEKNVPPMEHHCCGCPNHHHPLYPKEQKAVRIEEEEPEKDRRRNDSLVPLQVKSSPYPIAWLPTDRREHGKAQNAEGGKDAKVHENGKTAVQQPHFLKGWLPVDLNNVVSSKQRGDGEENDHEDGGKRNFQFPLFWIPYNHKSDDMDRESHKVKDVNPKPSLESEIGSDSEEKFHLNSGKVGDDTASRVKDIPVKEAEQDVGKESSIVPEKERDASVRDRTDKGEKKIENGGKVSPTDGSNRKSPSPPKSSKLPPVCLRVDPLPRKKSANGKSRSPSPPGDKQRLEVKSNESSKAYSLDNREQVKDTKTIAVIDGNASPEKSTNVNVETPAKLPAESQDDVSVKQAEVVKPEDEHVQQKHVAPVKEQTENIVSAGGENEEPVGAEGVKVDEVKKRRDLSEEEAAVIIQSAFRRFDVCRWKPVEKLKQIAQVREQIGDIKRLIHDLELSSDVLGRAKQKNIISETIMSLLLKLDTIQGLHPSIREIRKSVVKELVSLQERLDSLMIENPEDSPEQEVMSRCDNEDASNKNDVMKSENDSKEIISVDLQSQIDEESKSQEANLIEEEAEILRIGTKELSERYMDDGVMKSESDGNEINSVDLQSQIDDGSKSEEANLIEEEAAILKIGVEEASERYVDEGIVKSENDSTEINSVNLQNQTDDRSNSEEENMTEEEAAILKVGMGEASESSGDEGIKAAQIPANEDEKSSEVLQNNEASIAEGDNEAIIPVQGSELSSLQDDHVVHSELTELPQGVLDDLYAAEGTNNSAVEAESSKCIRSKQPHEKSIGSPVVEESHHETADEDNHQTTEPNEALELPLDGAELQSEEAELCGVERPQQPANLTADLVEPSEEKLLHDDRPHEISGLMMEEQKHLDSVLEEGDLENTSVINEHVNSSDALNMDEVEMEMVSKQGQECNTEHPAPKESTEEELEGAVEVGEDIKESNRRLMVENERLREMIEKLIKSGQEQVRAISDLSGRVKDMEKRLSRKKKLKVKQFKAPRSSKFDAFVGDDKTM